MNWDDFIYFFSFDDRNISLVIVGCIILGGLAAWIGSFTIVQKRALLGDAISHAVLPGICLGFLYAGSKHPFWLMLGACITGWLSILSIDGIVRYSKIKADTSIALVLSVFFGIGILLLTIIQHSGNAEQSGLEHFLFGKAAALGSHDLIVFGSSAALIIIILLLFHRGFWLISFDKTYAQSIGFPIRLLQFILSTSTVLTVAIGIQAMGVILMAALLITPATAARMWTHKLPVMIVLSVLFGMFSGVFGAYASYVAPSMPTGPWIVIMATFIVAISIFFAPKRGLIATYSLKKKNHNKITEENVLKCLFHLSEPQSNKPLKHAIKDLIDKRYFEPKQLLKAIGRLEHKNWVIKSKNHLKLSDKGNQEAIRIVRNHRLWELYLTTYVGLKADHVHDDAEAMEHLITPEIEAELSKLLDHPDTDPHNKQIPSLK